MLALLFGSKKDKIEKLKERYFNKQLKLEKKKKLKHLYDIGNFKPYPVYCGNSDILQETNKIEGLCSLCENPIHISIGTNPKRLILSHVIDNNGEITKDECFYIMNIYDNITSISDITQYIIYNAIQSYINENNKYPKYVKKDEGIIKVAI